MASKKKCIKCKDEEMIPMMVEDVEVDFCSSCHGIWLDRDEINRLAEKSEEALHDILAMQAGKPDTPPEPIVDLPCPACGGKLTIAVFMPMLLERCTRCHGLFLDRGELEKAMAEIKERGNEVVTISALARSVVTRGIING